MAKTDSASSQPTEAAETRLLVRHGFELARELDITRVLVFSELITDRRLVEKHRENESLIWVTYDRDSMTKTLQKGDHCVKIPESPVGRMDQITLALITAVLNGAMSEKETVLCLVGVAGSKRLDNVLMVNPKRDFTWFSNHSIKNSRGIPGTQAFIQLLEIALKFAGEGREGKPVGTIFVLGEPEECRKFTKPLILNPCRGHPKKARAIYDLAFVETMRELSALDGAFLIDHRGVVDRAGVYLDAPATKRVKVSKGLGSRHVAAAAITAKLTCVAIVISESSGTVTVFSEGEEVLSLNRPMRS